MCNFLDAAPVSGDHCLAVGSDVVLGLDKAINIDIGKGSITAMTGTMFTADGTYDFDVLGHKGSGTWKLSLDQSSGSTWSLKVGFTGTFAGAISGSAACSQSGKDDDTEIVYTGDFNGSSRAITQSYQNDTWSHKAKLYFDNVPAGSHDVKLYFYNADYN